MQLEELALAKSANGAEINACRSNQELISKEAINSKISDCKSRDYLVNGDTEACEISRCYSNRALIKGTASRTIIADCEVFYGKTSSHFGVADQVCENSRVERCFISGRLVYTFTQYNFRRDFDFFGISSLITNSTVRCCALGKVTLNGKNDRINHYTRTQSSVLENNVTTYAHNGFDDNMFRNVDSIFLSQQRYFQDTLGWDFDSTWQWDDINHRPTLRWINNPAPAEKTSPGSSSATTVDLFTQQVRANIWL